MGISCFDLKLERKELTDLNVKSKVNYWRNIVKAAGSTHTSEQSSYLNSDSNSHKKKIILCNVYQEIVNVKQGLAMKQK